MTASWYGDAIVGREMSNQKGGSHVVDNCCGTGNFVAAGAGDRLYDGLFYPYPAGHRNRCGGDRGHSGAKTWINDLPI